MAVVPVDNRRRITLPRETKIMGTKAIVIPAGSFVVVVPLPKEPLKEAGSWLRSKRSRAELKKLAESLARKESIKRAKRHKQI